MINFIKDILKIMRSYNISKSIENNLINTTTVKYNSTNIKFINTNKLLKFRIKNFLTKEPETIQWIKEFRRNSYFWDIGSNIGEFSIFAAKLRNCEVVSFEPSFFNLQILIKNIFINNLQNNITTLPFAINDKTKSGMFKIQTFQPGHANSSFETNIGWNGKPINTKFEYKTMSITIDDAINFFNLKAPNYIKIDVDGNEHLVLEGARKTLKEIEEVLIELPGVWTEQTKLCHEILLASGLTRTKKHNFDMLNNPNVSANEIWKRK